MFKFLYWLIRSSVVTFWIMDILNMPFMEKFDTTYPLNTWFWILMFICLGGLGISWRASDEKDK